MTKLEEKIKNCNGHFEAVFNLLPGLDFCKYSLILGKETPCKYIAIDRYAIQGAKWYYGCNYKEVEKNV